MQVAPPVASNPFGFTLALSVAVVAATADTDVAPTIGTAAVEKATEFGLVVLPAVFDAAIWHVYGVFWLRPVMLTEAFALVVPEPTSTSCVT